MRSTVLQQHRYLFAAVIAAQVADVATLLIGLTRVSIHAEQNPLVRGLYISMGPAGPIAMKVFTLLAIVPMMWWLAEKNPGRGRILPAAVIAIAVGLFGVWANVTYGILA